VGDSVVASHSWVEADRSKNILIPRVRNKTQGNIVSKQLYTCVVTLNGSDAIQKYGCFCRRLGREASADIRSGAAHAGGVGTDEALNYATCYL